MVDHKSVASRERIPFSDLMIACVSGLSLAVTLVFLCAVPLSGHMAGSRDFVSYWATGHQLAVHANPYDAEALKKIEHGVGLEESAVLLMRNPPWALPLAYPLGFIGLRTAAALWSLVLLGCLSVSVYLIGKIYNFSKTSLYWLGLSFPPALICMIMGQTSLFALLGLVSFLSFHNSRPFTAGVSLWLCALKPHLFLPFFVVLLAWILVDRHYRLLAGAAVAVAASVALTYSIAPRAWRDYSTMMHAPDINQQFVPCLSDAIRIWLRPQATWIQYLPAILSCAWALRYFWLRRDTWNWTQNGSVLMLVSLVSAPYCWLYDQGLAIPALLHGAYLTRSRTLVAVLALASLLIDFELCGFKITSPLYLWTAPAWLVWYVFAHATNTPTPRTSIPSRYDRSPGPVDTPGTHHASFRFVQ